MPVDNLDVQALLNRPRIYAQNSLPCEVNNQIHIYLCLNTKILNLMMSQKSEKRYMQVFLHISNVFSLSNNFYMVGPDIRCIRINKLLSDKRRIRLPKKYHLATLPAPTLYKDWEEKNSSARRRKKKK